MPTIEASYSKKIGLKNYSSHSFSVTIRTEVTDLGLVEKESAQLYALLQESVDRNIQEEGFIPETSDNRSTSEPARSNGNGARNHRSNGHSSSSNGNYWRCSEKQQDLIQKIINEHRLDNREVEQLCDEMFRKPLKSLNKLEMSGVIQELLDKYGPSNAHGGNGNSRRSYQRGGRR
jgi:hypothetical protein